MHTPTDVIAGVGLGAPAGRGRGPAPQDQAQTLSGLVDKLLALKTLAPQGLEWEEVDLKRLVTETVRVWQKRAQSKQITLDLQVVADLPAIRGDCRMLQEALDQLLDNAFKFSGKGEAISVRVESCEGEVRISVSDTGIGIPPDRLESVFEPFYQVDGSSTRRHGGAGIGLSLVRRIISLHGGRVWAESEGLEGRGTTVRIALPIVSTSKT